MRLRRGFVVTAIGSTALVMSLASVAWACVNVDPPTVDVSPGRGPAETVVRVTGTNWGPGKAVTIVFGSGGFTNATTDENGRFSVGASIPSDAANGVHIVKASSADNSARTPFEVTAPAAVATGSGGGPTTGTGGTGKTTGRLGGISGTPTDDALAAPLPGTVSGAPAPGSADLGPSRTAIGGLAQPGGGPPAPSRVSVAPRGGTGSAAVNPTGTPPPGDGQGLPVLAPGTALGDLWSGFATGADTVSRPRGLNDLTTPRGTSGTSPQALGMGLLAAGAVALFAGFAFAEVSRRRMTIDGNAHTRSDA